MQHPAVPPAIALLVGVGLGVQFARSAGRGIRLVRRTDVGLHRRGVSARARRLDDPVCPDQLSLGRHAPGCPGDNPLGDERALAVVSAPVTGSASAPRAGGRTPDAGPFANGVRCPSRSPDRPLARCGRVGLRRRRGECDRRRDACRHPRRPVGEGAQAADAGDPPARCAVRQPRCPQSAPRADAAWNQPAGIGQERTAGRGRRSGPRVVRGRGGRSESGEAPRRADGGSLQPALVRRRNRGVDRGSGRSRSGGTSPSAGGWHLSRDRHLRWQHRDPVSGTATAAALPWVLAACGLNRDDRMSAGVRLDRRQRGVGCAGDVCSLGVLGRDGHGSSSVADQHAGAVGNVSGGRGTAAGG